MNQLTWTNRFTRAVKRSIKRNPDLGSKIDFAFKLLEENINHPLLHTHKLKGELEGSYACTVDYDYRMIFDILSNASVGLTEILLLSFGTHKEVY
jgi:addiction module RelE/StbE family toxin